MVSGNPDRSGKKERDLQRISTYHTLGGSWESFVSPIMNLIICISFMGYLWVIFGVGVGKEIQIIRSERGGNIL